MKEFNPFIQEGKGIKKTEGPKKKSFGYQILGFGSGGVPPKFVAATGGTITTSGNFKIHTFTGNGTFSVTCAGDDKGSNTVSYIVVAGGGGTGYGGGGAGGFRESRAAGDSYTASPLNATSGPLYNIPVSVQGYPVSIGGGGGSGPSGVYHGGGGN